MGVFVGWVPVASAATATQAPALQQAADELVAAGVPGVVVLVRDGHRTTRIASGYGNLAKQTPIRVTDKFRVASLTKTFVATVVLQLVGERTLALDDTVERWIPGVFPDGDAIRIRQLLNHTSGIYDAQNDPAILAPYFAGDLTHFTPPLELVQVAAAHELLFPPGSNWSYSNANYFVVGLIIEAATGNPLGSELRRRIFRPLDLTTRHSRAHRGSPGLTPTVTSSSANRRCRTSRSSAHRSSGPGERSSRPPVTSGGSTGHCCAVACSAGAS
jgi:D-alanyl-D-alanine carboxypeptidase